MNRSKLPKRLKTIESLFRSGFDQHCYIASALRVQSREGVLLECTGGHAGDGSPVISETQFDLASLTKPVATASSILMLADRGVLRTSDRLSKILPQSECHPIGSRSILSLLTHTSGLPAWIDLHSRILTMRSRISTIMEQSLQDPGTRYVYSDLGYMLLGEVVRRACGEAIDRFTHNHLFLPLGMNHTRFRPPPTWRSRAVPTEFDVSLNAHLCGIVHDANCRAWGGVCGHAGLFSTLEDLSRFCLEVLAPRSSIISRRTRKEMFENQIPDVGGASCGWFMPPSRMLPAMESFRRRKLHVIGHTGFTGTSIAIVPSKGLFLIFLSNRVYYGRNTPNFRQLRIDIHRQFAGLCGD